MTPQRAETRRCSWRQQAPARHALQNELRTGGSAWKYITKAADGRRYSSHPRSESPPRARFFSGTRGPLPADPASPASRVAKKSLLMLSIVSHVLPGAPSPAENKSAQSRSHNSTHVCAFGQRPRGLPY